MFHDRDRGRDASKVALLRLVAQLRDVDVELLDVQWLTAHLATLGAIEVRRPTYLAKLESSLALPMRIWRQEALDGATLLERLGEIQRDAPPTD
jgi:leucyl/phenylalanyl-tRNA---protein transferase